MSPILLIGTSMLRPAHPRFGCSILFQCRKDALFANTTFALRSLYVQLAGDSVHQMEQLTSYAVVGAGSLGRVESCFIAVAVAPVPTISLQQILNK